MRLPIRIAPMALAGSLIAAWLSLPVTGNAGAICGTVRDARTAAAVPLAGIFVRTPAGAYTGLHSATDSTGTYCVANVPAGTYDLEIQVNHYEVAYVRGVVVTDDVTNVDAGAILTRFYLAPPSPNPARASVLFRLGIGEETPVELAVYDVAGRLLRRWNDRAPGPGERTIQWDFRDSSGRYAPPGVYFVRLGAGPVRLTRSFVILD